MYIQIHFIFLAMARNLCWGTDFDDSVQFAMNGALARMRRVPPRAALNLNLSCRIELNCRIELKRRIELNSRIELNC